MNAVALPYEGHTDTPSLATLHQLPAGKLGSVAAPVPCLSGREKVGSRGAAGEGVAPAFSIYPETAGDVAPRDRLLDRAMKPNWRRKSSEKIRRGRQAALAFVARDEAGAVVGTVRLWNVALGEGGQPALLLGPLAVDPSIRSSGIGGALMRQAIGAARNGGHGAVMLVGDAEYYSRFGFSADKTGALAMPGPFEKHRLLALELVPSTLDGASGVIRPTGVKLARAA